MTEVEKKPAKRAGRPPKKPALGKRVNVMFRLNEMTRGQVMRKADEAGRSMSEELEHRTEQSLRKDTRLYAISQMIGGDDMLMFNCLMSGDLKIAIESANDRINNNNNWYKDEDKLKLVKTHMSQVIDRAIDTFANMMRTGVAAKAGGQTFEGRDGFPVMHPEQDEGGSD